MKARHKGREIALQTLYALDFNQELTQGVPADFPATSDLEIAALEPEVLFFARYLISGTLENLIEIDQLINHYSVNRPLDKIDLVDRNILRLSIFTLLYAPEIHSHVIIDEAVKLSQEFSSEVNYKFVNGMLDSMCKQIRHDTT